MIEMLGVLAIIGVLSAGGIMGYSVAMNNSKMNTYFNDVRNMVTGAFALGFKKFNINRITVNQTDLIRLGLLPEKYEQCTYNGCSPLNGLAKGGNFAIWSNYIEAIVFEPTYGFCVEFMTRDWGKGLNPTLPSRKRISDGGGVIYIYSTTSRATVENYCKTATRLDAYWYLK